jgi:phosphate starvation-inducible membrane PsiE
MAIITTVAFPESWIAGRVNFAFLPYALLTLAVLWLPNGNVELKILYLWLTAPLGALLFLAQDAADHIQIAYTAWALLAAFGLQDFCSTVFRLCNTDRLKTVLHSTRWLLASTLTILAGIILFYQYLTFGALVTTYWQAKYDSQNNPNSIYNWLYGSIPRPRKLFSNPRLGGWKAVGYLHETGQLTGDFRSVNESFAVPIWYNFQTPRSCYDDPDNYWVRRSYNGWPDEEQDVINKGYKLTRIILVDQQPKLHLYEEIDHEKEPEIIDSEQYRHLFDLLATPARFAQGEMIQQSASLNFGDKLLLKGYNIPRETVQPAELLPVTVFWETLAPMEIRYRAFMHMVDEAGNRWAQHDDDPACRLLTTEMRPAQDSSRQFRLSIDPATPPGEYQILLGLYDPADFQRLNIWDNLGNQPAGDSIVLGTVRVE